MRTLIILSLTIVASAALGELQYATIGKSSTLELSHVKVKYFTRELKSGETQKFYVDEPNKNSWVDDKTGKKIVSSNYKYKAPGTLIIEKVSKSDLGSYDFEPLEPRPTPPPGVDVDPGTVGIDLETIEKD